MCRIISARIACCRGGTLTLKGGMGMSGSKDPFSHLSHHSLDPQLQHDSVL